MDRAAMSAADRRAGDSVPGIDGLDPQGGALASVDRVVGTYAAAMETLRCALPGLAEPIGRAVAAILAMDGRLIVAGMGKSGHVGRKLAATFASTGTPAHFVHPAEASHGDLGMIRGDDVLLMLSWSGETRELSDLIAHAKRFSVPVIALTGAPDATLARRADVALVLPRAEEACPMGLAPTTSTLLQMAMGDALAVAALEAQGFTAEDFRGFHPGGKLGAALSTVAEVMHAREVLPLLPEDAPALEVIGEIGRRGFGIVGLLDAEGRLAGVVTDGDLRRYLEANAGGGMDAVMARPARELMTPGSITVGADRLASTALALLQRNRISCAFVLDVEGRPRGMVSMLELLRVGVA
jgi:arabinose-5-phosphate isomerase